MKTRILLWLLLLLSGSAWAQNLSVTESFEDIGGNSGEGSRYFSSTPIATATGAIYFQRTGYPVTIAGNATAFGNVSNLPTQSTIDGTKFWVGEATPATPLSTVTLAGIPNAQSYTGIKVAFAAADPRVNTDGSIGGARVTYHLRVQYAYSSSSTIPSNASFQTSGEFTGNNSSGASRWYRYENGTFDLNQKLDKGFLTFSNFNIPAGTGFLFVRIQLEQAGSSGQEIAFDNIQVTGTRSAASPPTLSTTDAGSVAYTEGGAATSIFGNLTADNPSGSTLDGAKVIYTNGRVAAQDELTYTIPGGSGITLDAANSTNGTLAFTGASSETNYQSLLLSVKYRNNTSTAARGGTRSFAFTVSNGASTSGQLLRDVVVAAKLNDAVGLAQPFVEDFEDDGEGTTYGSNTGISNTQGFVRLTGAPGATFGSSTTFSSIQGSGYFYGKGTKEFLFASSNGLPTAGNGIATPAGGVLVLAPINTTGFTDLHFKYRAAAAGSFFSDDFLRFSYNLNDGAGWQSFPSGNFTSPTGQTGPLRRDGNASGLALTTAMQDVDITLPAAVAGTNVSFRVEVADNGSEEIAFDNIQITGTPVPTTVTSIVRASTNPTNANSVQFTVTFAASVTGLTASNFNLTTTGALGTTPSVSSVSGSGTTYTVTVNTGTGSGTLRLNLNNSTGLTPSVSNVPFTSGDVYNIDKDGPAVSSVAAPANGTYRTGQTLSFTANFSEAVTVTGTPQLALTIGATARQAAYVSGTGTAALVFSYTVQSGDQDTDGIALGTLGLNGGTLRDALGNNATLTLNGVPSTTGILVDGVAPTVSSSNRQNPTGSSTSGTSVTFRVTFSEPVTGVTTSSFTLVTTTGSTSGSISSVASVSGSNGTQYDVTASSLSGNGTIRLDVKSSGSGITDVAGNGLSGGFSTGQTYDIVQNVTVTAVTGLTPTPTATNTVSYQVTFSNAVLGLTINNFNLTTSGFFTAPSVSSVSGSGSTYTVVVNTGGGDGTLRLNVNNSTGVTPTLSNVPYTSGTTYTITKSFGPAPTLRIQAAGSAVGNSDVTAFVDVVQVLSGGSVFANGLQNGSFETNNVPANDFKKNTPTNGVVATPWIFAGTTSGVTRDNINTGFKPPIPPNGDAAALLQSINGDNSASISQKLAVPTGSYQINFQAAQRYYTSFDQRLNVFVNDVFVGNFQPTGSQIYEPFTSATFNVTAPALIATVSTTSASPTSTAPIPFSVSFTDGTNAQSVGSSFTASDVTVLGGTLNTASFSGSGAGPYTFTVTPSGAGTVSVSLAANVAQDANNTGNSASNTVSVQFQVQTAAPVVTAPANNSSVVSSQPTYNGTAPANSTVTVYVDGTSRGTTTADAGGNWTLTQPTALSSGSHTVYATAQASGEAVSNPSNTNTFTVLGTATYVSSTAEQLNTGIVQVGSTNQEILRVGVVIGGGTSAPLSTTSLTFTTTGTTRPADIATARVYYTGTSGTLMTTTLFGSAVATPNGTFTVTGNQLLTTGTNYFFLVYDVAATATPGGVLDATLTSLTVGGTVRTPTVTAPTGNRRIVQTSRVAGTALRFVGGTTPGYVDFSASTTAAPVLGSAYTQMAWIKPAVGTGSDTYYVLGNGTGNTAAPYIAITGNGRVEAGFGTGSTLRSIRTGPQTITANVWSQIVATFNGSALTVYLNGEVIALVTVTDSPAATRVNYVGNAGTSGTSFYPGDIDEVSQWNRALSQTEIRLLRHLTLSGAENGLVSYLQFNDNGTTTLDGISGAVGTLTGATRVISTAPVGAGTSNLQSVTATGNYAFTGTNVAINFTTAGSTPYDIVVSRLEGTPLGTPVTDANLRSTHTRAYWIVDRYSTSTFSANITYTLDQGLISAGDAAAPGNLKLYKRGSNSDGAFDAPISANAANAVASTVTFPVSSFSQTFIGTYGTSPLPVELVRFTAERRQNDALLTWATAQEKNNAYFEAESSVDGRTFRTVGRVAGHGSSTQPHDYQLTDKNLARYGAPAVYYRLRQVDLDGTVSLSSVQTVQVPRVAADLTATVFPNPAADQLTIRLSSQYAGQAQGWLFDAQGRSVLELGRQLSAATGTDIPLSVKHLPTGIYTLRLVLDGHVIHQQIVVQH